MFHFPTFPLPALYIQAGVGRSYCYTDRGFPIRIPSDQSPLIGSPRLIADCYVLLRLQMPRHSPFALINLTTYMSMNRVRHTTRRRHVRHDQWFCLSPEEQSQNIVFDLCPQAEVKDARVHCVVLNVRSALPPGRHHAVTSKKSEKPDPTTLMRPGVDPSGPNSVHATVNDPASVPSPASRAVLTRRNDPAAHRRCSTRELPPPRRDLVRNGRERSSGGSGHPVNRVADAP